jgi:hypothetical protein
MKSLVLGFIAVIAVMTSSSTWAADDRNVTVVNGTGYGIKFLGFNNPGDNDWSDNELGKVLKDGESIYVKFNNADKGCKWNIRIDWADEGYPGVLWKDMDLCAVDQLTLRWDKASNTTSFVTK